MQASTERDVRDGSVLVPAVLDEAFLNQEWVGDKNVRERHHSKILGTSEDEDGKDVDVLWRPDQAIQRHAYWKSAQRRRCMSRLKFGDVSMKILIAWINAKLSEPTEFSLRVSGMNEYIEMIFRHLYFLILLMSIFKTVYLDSNTDIQMLSLLELKNVVLVL